MFIRPQRYEASVRCKEYLTEKVLELTLALNTPDTINFSAGQFVSVEVESGEYRAYSISSPENEHLILRLLVEVSHEGKGSEYIRSLKVGDRVNFIGPSGKFTLPPLLPEHLVFIATGVGFAPFESMLAKLMDIKYKGKVDFFLGIRTPDELFKLEYLQKVRASLKDFSFTLCFSQKLASENAPESPNTVLGRVTQVVAQKLNLEQLQDSETLFLMCGNPAMVTDMLKILEKYSIKIENILFEKFT
jgi:Na+-transporting NADH:ubiquinone oxidoreductase subunit F